MPVCEDAENGVQSEQKVRKKSTELSERLFGEQYTIFGGSCNLLRSAKWLR